MKQSFPPKIRSICSQSKENKLALHLPRLCNYRCSYCIQGATKVSSFSEPFFDNQRISVINKIVSRFHIQQLSLMGGEPTLIDLYPLFEALTKPVKRILIITNFSRSNEYFIKLNTLARSKGSEIWLICSLHEEFVDYKKFVAKVNDLHLSGYERIRIEFVVARSNLKQAKDIIAYIQTHSNPQIGLAIDFDYNDQSIKRKYEIENLVSNNNSTKNLVVNYDDGSTEIKSIQELRLFQMPTGEKYCFTNLTLKENYDLFLCERKLFNFKGESFADLDKISNIETFKCNISDCMFCYEPRIFFNLNDAITAINDFDLNS